MRRRTLISSGIIACVLCLGVSAPSSAQLLKRLKDAVKRTAESDVERRVEEVTMKGMECVFNDLECIKRAQEQGEEVVLTDEEGEILTDDQGNTYSDPSELAPAEPPSTYDFEPGTRVLFEEDFSADLLGDFPRRLEFIKGNMQVVDWNGQRFLRADAKNSRFAIVLSAPLPEMFTIEFDLYDPHGSSGVGVALSEPPNFGWAWAAYYEGHYFNAGRRQGSGLWGGQGDEAVAVTPNSAAKEGVVPVRIMADGNHIKMFLGEHRVANMPSAQLTRGEKIYFFLEPLPPDLFTYIGNLRIAAGGRDLYDALEAEGRVTVNDILFDTGAATIRSESEAVLSEIGTMLQEHSELNLLIEGHTDNEGGFDLNMRLSGDRAASVKTYLVETFGVDSDRLRTMGLGMTRSVASNDTPEGRQQNRRVELVRM